MVPPVALVVRRATTAFIALLLAVSGVAGFADRALAQAGGSGQMAGMGISPPSTPQQAIATDLPRMRGAGINTASIDVWWDVDAETQTEVTPGSITASDADLRLAIQKAKAAGMKVILEPKIWCPRCRPSTWRGYIDPADPATFFTNYRAMVDHYAELAQGEGVDIFYLGSEMSMVQDETEEWRQLAREVRQRYRGTLTYGVNWNVLSRVHFWDVVDVVSVSAYFPLSGEARPTVDELKAAWRSSKDPAWRGRKWFDEVVALHNDTRKPLFFGEAGYLSSTYAASKPYDETETHDPDQELQSDAYQALLETFQGQSWWMGVVWWEWTLSSGNDMGYSPRNKIAEKLLKAWYVDGWRPSAAQRSVYDPPPPPPTAAAGAGAGSAGSGTAGRTATAGASAAGGKSANVAAAGGATVGTQSATGATGSTDTTASGAAAPGAGDAGTSAGLSTDEAAAGARDGTSSSRSVLVAMAIGALLFVLLPLSALARRFRQSVELLTVDEPARNDGERIGPRA